MALAAWQAVGSGAGAARERPGWAPATTQASSRRGPLTTGVPRRLARPTQAPGPRPTSAAAGATPAAPPCRSPSAIPLGVSVNNALPQLLPLAGCITGGIVRSVFTVIGSDGTVLVSRNVAGVLPVDLAVSPDGLTVAGVAPGNASTPNLPTVFQFSTCGDFTSFATSLGDPGGAAQPVAVAFDPSSNLLVQTREPALLWVIDPSSGNKEAVRLASVSREDTGHDIFHIQAGAMIACASCHPEGRDDGHMWTLDGNARRTPSLSGTIKGTAPYHWPGDMKDLTRSWTTSTRCAWAARRSRPTR